MSGCLCLESRCPPFPNQAYVSRSVGCTLHNGNGAPSVVQCPPCLDGQMRGTCFPVPLVEPKMDSNGLELPPHPMTRRAYQLHVPKSNLTLAFPSLQERESLRVGWVPASGEGLPCAPRGVLTTTTRLWGGVLLPLDQPSSAPLIPRCPSKSRLGGNGDEQSWLLGRPWGASLSSAQSPVGSETVRGPRPPAAPLPSGPGTCPREGEPPGAIPVFLTREPPRCGPRKRERETDSHNSRRPHPVPYSLSTNLFQKLPSGQPRGRSMGV